MNDQRVIEAVERVLRGEEGAFTDLCRLKGRDILYISMHLMGDMQDGEDAAQEVLVYMHKHIRELKTAEAFQSWLYRIMRGICSNMKQRRKNTARDLSQTKKVSKVKKAELQPQDFAANSENRKILLRAVEGLSSKYKVCVFMFYCEGMRYREIARILDAKSKDVENALRRARKNIHSELKKADRGAAETQAVLPAPLVAQAVKDNMMQSVSAAKLKRFVDLGTGLASGTLTAENITSGGSKAGNGSAVSSPGASAAKITLGVAAAFGVTAAAAAFIQDQQTEADTIAAYEETVTWEKEQTGSVPEAEEEEGRIITLEDMIGAPEAELLREFTSGSVPGRSDVEDFLTEVGCVVYESVWNPVNLEEHTLYVFEKQEKLLMVIIGYQVDSERCETAYRFTKIDEDYPQDVRIPICYQEWQDNQELQEGNTI